MQKRGKYVGMYLILAVVLTYWLGVSSQEIGAQPTMKVPFLEEWASSGHADAKAEAFNDWNEAQPAEVPAACAKCHSTPGHLDFLGVDGSEAGKVDKPAPIGTVIECVVCHNPVSIKMTSVMMPSGVELTGLGDEARCMQCHQGRQSKSMVDAAIAKVNATDLDTPSKDLGFANIHYFAAAATKYGTVTKGGYEYDDKMYDANFAHVEQFDTCIECHDPHTLKLNLTDCSTCHKDVQTAEDLKDVRMAGSLVDYDGDGNVEEGIYYEVEGLRDLLYQAIQAYALEKGNVAIAYDPANYPYFLVDTNNNGRIDPEEAKRENSYKAWTPRLLKAAYNYQVSTKDPGAYAHGGKYIIQLLSDSIADLNSVLAAPIALEKAHRLDAGHFAGSEIPFRYWDKAGQVPATCSKCHSAAGLPLFLKDNTAISQTPSNGFQCSTCHDELTKFSRYDVKKVQFPSGAVVTSEDATTNLCMNCHQGRESAVSVHKLTAGLEGDAVSEKLRFLNVHYFAAGATKYGTEAKGGYEYEGKTYAGLFKHVPNYAGCTSCHDAHKLEVKADLCGMCHPQAKDGGSIEAIRMTSGDYDGDKADEGIAGEIETLREALYAAIQDYAKNTVKTPIVYDAANYPYFLTDTNGNGQVDPDEAKRENGYQTWTPKLLQAAYNYQYATKDPGGFAHNGKYIIQLLFDSLDSLSGTQAGMTRP